MLISSIFIDPTSNPIILDNANDIVDFPAPVLPTTPIFSPGLISKDKPFKTKSAPGLYLKYTSLKSSFPYYGHSSGT